MLTRFAVFGCALALLPALLPSSAVATHVSCGDVITQDTTLDSDLVNCPGEGVVIGASGITLDLAGHLIDGARGPFSSARGVDNRAGHDGVTVTDGTIHDFFFAVDARRAQGGGITRLETPEGIYLQDSPDILVEHNATGPVHAFGSSHRVVIARNDITGTILVVGGYVSPPPPCCPDSPAGSPADVVVNRNTIISSFGQGISMISAPGATVARNEVIATNPGEPPVAGITISTTSGAGGPRTLVERNTVSGSTTGIRLTRAHRTIVSRNTIFDNVADGLLVTQSLNVLIDGNTAVRNGDDGIDLDSAPGTISNNTANFNGDFGIEAVPGVIDGGGNKAHGNGQPAQCVNVQCK
jgi:parallel beta-helix repeat protein